MQSAKLPNAGAATSVSGNEQWLSVCGRDNVQYTPFLIDIRLTQLSEPLRASTRRRFPKRLSRHARFD
jgi:hypothetical protein